MTPVKLTPPTPPEAARSLAARARALRLLEGFSRATLAARAGVSPASLKRFENTGKASLELVLAVAHALGRLEDFERLLQPPPARSLEELERLTGTKPRQRGRT